jgi:hypothetical protein
MNWKTTFWQDFSIADIFGEHAIRDTYNRAKDEWASNTEYVTELVIVLNHKIWQHYEKNNHTIAKVYDELWRELHEYCLNTLKGDDLRYYIQTTD